MYKNAQDFLRAVAARKAADQLRLEQLAQEEKRIEQEKNDELKAEIPLEQPQAEKKSTKKVKRDNSKEFLVEEKEQPVIEPVVEVDE